MAYQTAEIQHEERPLEIRNACEYNYCTQNIRHYSSGFDYVFDLAMLSSYFLSSCIKWFII